MTATASPDAGLTVRSFRAIGTTATVVVQDPDQADVAERAPRPEPSRRSTWPAAGSAMTPSWPCSTPSPAAPCGSRACCSRRSRWPAGLRPAPAVRSIPRSAMPSARSGTTPISTRSGRGRPPPPQALGAVPGYWHVQLNSRTRTVRIPRGVRLDLGSSAKALAADRAAARIAHAVDGGVLVSLGGDVAVAGAAAPRGMGRRHRPRVVDPGRGGRSGGGHQARWAWPVRPPALARGSRAAAQVHHIVDPRTGDCAEPYWSLVSATGSLLRRGQPRHHGLARLGR